MIYLVICLWLLGSIMCYGSLVEESIELSEKVAWVIFWPFLTSAGVAFGVSVWVYEKVTRNKVRF